MRTKQTFEEARRMARLHLHTANGDFARAVVLLTRNNRQSAARDLARILLVSAGALEASRETNGVAATLSHT